MDPETVTNWKKCYLCQEDKSNECLRSPLSSFQREVDYAGFNVPLFNDFE